ncbi:MAG TPA: tyrosine-type recombinase/integrase [Clostridia bacterium]|jgi:site-specific recombinase XerD|nr:tyrosine-type recombinase/integrase [Clostridia bacterium]
MEKTNYFELKKYNQLSKLNDILENNLPFFCREFFVGISMRVASSTQLNYARDLVIFFDFLVKKINHFYGKSINSITLADLDALESQHIEFYLSYLSYYKFNGKIRTNNERGKARKLSAIKSMLNYFYKRDLIQENVSLKVDTPKIHDKPIIRLDNDEVESMLSVVEKESKFHSSRQDNYNSRVIKRDTALLTLLLGTGIRVSECVGLNLLDIDFKNNAFKVTRKGGNISVLYFSNEIKQALDDYIIWRYERLAKANKLDTPALFISLQNKRITTRAVENIVKKYAKLISPLKSISPHKLRSTYGTALYRETKDIFIVAEVLGHKDVNTTKKHYAAISEDIKKDAATRVKLRRHSQIDTDK